jgi:hypothetical protein
MPNQRNNDKRLFLIYPCISGAKGQLQAGLRRPPSISLSAKVDSYSDLKFRAVRHPTKSCPVRHHGGTSEILLEGAGSWWSRRALVCRHCGAPQRPFSTRTGQARLGQSATFRAYPTTSCAAEHRNTTPHGQPFSAGHPIHYLALHICKHGTTLLCQPSKATKAGCSADPFKRSASSNTLPYLLHRVLFICRRPRLLLRTLARPVRRGLSFSQRVAADNWTFRRVWTR